MILYQTRIAMQEAEDFYHLPMKHLLYEHKSKDHPILETLGIRRIQVFRKERYKIRMRSYLVSDPEVHHLLQEDKNREFLMMI